jgi:redox-sensitive bicupin YhaK (pirin superfamily)
VEIVTYVREGTVTHRGSRGNVGRTAADDVQAMSAGTGIRHSEYGLERKERSRGRRTRRYGLAHSGAQD